jgi:site-specific recombinase XerC
MGTLSGLVDRYLAEQQALGNLGRDTAIRDGYRLRRFADSFGQRPLDQLTARAVERWLMSLEHLSAGTRRLNLSNVRSFCRWLIERDLIRRDPTARIRVRKPRTVPRGLTRDQVVRLVAALPDLRALVIVVLMIQCGLRCCEVSRLEVADYDAHDQTIRVVGKGGHERVLPVPVLAQHVLRAHLVERGTVGGPMVQSRNRPGRALVALTISTLMAGWMRDAGIKVAAHDGVSAHALRHTCASDVLDKCGNVRTVQTMLGHKSLATTEVYLRRASQGQLREAMEGRDYAA